MTEYVSQGDGFLMNDNDPTRPMVMYYHNLIMQYAEQGDVQSVRHNLRLVKGSSGALARALHRAALGDGRVLKVLLEAAGTAATAELNTRSEYGWTALSRAACQGKSECVALLLAAGADPDRRIVDHVYNHTPLAMATLGAQQFGTNIPPPYAQSQRVFYLLLRAGATLEGMIRVVVPLVLPEGLQFGPAKLPVDTDDPYLRKVVAAGGFRNYEKAHRQALAKTFARVVFPRLPVDAMSHVVAFAFHTGGY